VSCGGRILIATADYHVSVATKFMPLPWRWERGGLLRALSGRLLRLGLAQVDLYQMLWPFPPVSIETWMAALDEAASPRLFDV